MAVEPKWRYVTSRIVAKEKCTAWLFRRVSPVKGSDYFVFLGQGKIRARTDEEAIKKFLDKFFPDRKNGDRAMMAPKQIDMEKMLEEQRDLLLNEVEDLERDEELREVLDWVVAVTDPETEKSVEIRTSPEFSLFDFVKDETGEALNGDEIDAVESTYCDIVADIYDLYARKIALEDIAANGVEWGDE